MGRYIQADPIGLAGGVNVYQYAYGNPLVYYDSLGLICFNFDILANHVREYRAPLSVVLGTLVAELFYGVVPKTSFEIRRSFDSKNPDIHDYTNQPSRRVAKALKEGRITTEEAKAIRHKWRKLWMITHGIVVLLVAEGFYDLGVVMGGAWEATSFERCECN
ncbi:MAG: RHS repeat-associated core domain-containing protein [Ottowia sp.]